LVFIKKSNQTGFFKKTKTEPESVQTDRFRFGYFRKKGDSNRFGSVFFGLGSILFFQFQAYKTETEPVGFFKILIGFFSRFGFFGYFFSCFLGFSVFLLILIFKVSHKRKLTFIDKQNDSEIFFYYQIKKEKHEISFTGIQLKNSLRLYVCLVLG
jgi:hypothetical protein